MPDAERAALSVRALASVASAGAPPSPPLAPIYWLVPVSISVLNPDCKLASRLVGGAKVEVGSGVCSVTETFLGGGAEWAWLRFRG